MEPLYYLEINNSSDWQIDFMYSASYIVSNPTDKLSSFFIEGVIDLNTITMKPAEITESHTIYSLDNQRII